MRERIGMAAAAILSATALAACGGDDDDTTAQTVTVTTPPATTKQAPAATTVEPLSASMKRVLQRKADDLTRRGTNDGAVTITSVTCSSEIGPASNCDSRIDGGSGASVDPRYPLSGRFDVIVDKTEKRGWTAVPLDPDAREVAKPLRGALLTYPEDRG